MDSGLQEEQAHTEDYVFEIDADIVEKHTGAIKIMMSDKRSITTISTRLLVVGCIFIVVSLPFTLSLTRGYNLNMYAAINLMGLFAVYSGFYLRIHATRFPLLIIYEDNILFKKKNPFLFGPLKLFNFLHLYASDKFYSLQKKEIKNVLKLRSLLSTDIYFELNRDNSTIQPFLNVEKKYMEHIFLYLEAYMKDKS